MGNIRIGINGFGRIGRTVFRHVLDRPGVEVVAINDLGNNPRNLAYMLKYDSTHGRFHGEVAVDGDNLVVNGDRIRVLRHPDPAELPWRLLNVDLVLECSGAYSDRATAEKHIEAGAQRLLFSQPGNGTYQQQITGTGKVVKVLPGKPSARQVAAVMKAVAARNEKVRKAKKKPVS